MEPREAFLKKLMDESPRGEPGPPPSFAEILRETTMVRSFERGSYLALEADACDYLPVVLSGSVRIFKAAESGREITLYRIDAGESCVLTTVTEIAFSRMDARIADYLGRSAGDATLIKITHQALADELGTAREVVSRILKDLEKRGALRLGRGGITILDAKLLADAADVRD